LTIEVHDTTTFSERELGRTLKLELEKQKFRVFDKATPDYLTRFKVYLNKPVQTYSFKFEQFWKTKILPQQTFHLLNLNST